MAEGEEKVRERGKQQMNRNMKEGFDRHLERTGANINKHLQAVIPGICREAGALLVKANKAQISLNEAMWWRHGYVRETHKPNTSGPVFLLNKNKIKWSEVCTQYLSSAWY